MDRQDAFEAAGEVGFEGVEIVLREEERLERLLTDEGRDEIMGWADDPDVTACSISFVMFREYKGNQEDQASGC